MDKIGLSCSDSCCCTRRCCRFLFRVTETFSGYFAGWGSEKPKKGGGAYFYTRPDAHGDVAWGGEHVITLDEETPEIHKEYEAELAKNGVQCNMGHVSKYCTFK